MHTVGLPKKVSFEIGPYFLTLSWTHFSPVFVLMAQSMPKLWPIVRIPSDPGGNFLDDPLLLLGHQEEVKQNEIATKTKESNICRAALYLFQEKTQLQYNVHYAGIN